ncbi:glucose dehydrogenase [FAD, quinone]-like [Thrips palmi]|uniref:Glucose dehydrogenase [FAD, quinone]-like n=1 Tax=Thrips palmi TaxID=161013 RepID=A0A6P8YNS2_THRPL|nr:glucose dehydrogenase [FAD, quinone]-like [Thrips palmi]
MAKAALCAMVLLLAAVQCQRGPYRPSILEASLRSIWEITRMGRTEPRDTRDVLPEYDFIIVGAGTAGCALANRLSSVEGWKVLLIEAGREENYMMDIPIVANMLQFSEANWKYRTVPSDTACLGMANRQCNYPRGKVMGGSSVLNYMIYNRGHYRDYDQWELMGNPGWGYRDVLKYFLRLEDMTIPDLARDKVYHNVGGPVAVSYIPWHTPLAAAFLEAGMLKGGWPVDYNGPTQAGYSYLQVTMRNGTRWSSNRAYLGPIRDRRTLHVTKQSVATRILIDPVTREATGIEFVRDRRRRVVRARREVIISAGAINSPQLLMLSGIGPRAHLQEKNIPVVQDLAVGYNLMDHVSAGAVLFLVNQSVSLRAERILDSHDDYVDYIAYHTGPMSIPGGCESVGFIDLKDPNNPDGWPDLELLFNSGSVISEPTLRDNFGIDEALYQKIFAHVEGRDSWMPLPMLMRPKSKGRVMLRDRNPLRKPLIFHNYFQYPEDLEVLVDGVLRTIELSNTEPFQRFGSTLHDTPIPACKSKGFGTRAYWRCHIRHFPFTIYHQSGTCKMGPRSDPNAVVDSRLRVHGVGRLRVVDASIMPAIPAAHTNAPTYMIAEKAADMIKEDNGVPV